MAKKKETTPKTGAVVLMICGIIAAAMMVGCVFFPDEIFGIFLN